MRTVNTRSGDRLAAPTRRGQTVDAHIYPAPDPVVVARIIATKGIDAARERWHWCENRTLMSIARAGRAWTGIAPKHVSTRSHALDGREAVAVEAAFFLGSMAAVDLALDAGKNATRSLFCKRGIDLPKGHGERVAEGCLGRPINAGDETAVAEREAKRSHARAVCDVLAAALSLVPEQPATGRFRLPPVDDALRTALAGMSQSAIEAVFPALAVDDTPAEAPAEEAAPVAIPDPNPVIEVPAVSNSIPQRGRRVPNNSVLRLDHADGQDLVVLAAHYGVTPSALYFHWRKLGLSGRGRLAGYVSACKTDVAPVAETTVQEPVPEAVPVAPEPVAPSQPVDPYGALSFEEAIAEVAIIESEAPLGAHDLGRAVDLAAWRGLTPEAAIRWIREDIRSVAAARVAVPVDDVAAVAAEVYRDLMLADDARSTRQ